MKEIEESLIEIAKEQLKYFKEHKTVPSKEVLDTIHIIMLLENII